MEIAILQSKSKSDMKLLIDMAKKFGFDSRVLTDEEIEEIGLANAISEAETGEYIDVKQYLEKMSK
jgi:hypothetical protein